MSGAIRLALRGPLERTLDASAIAADRLSGLSEREIAALPVTYGGLPGTVGEFFQVQGERSTRVRLQGDLTRAVGIGTAMNGGELTVEGPAGRDAGMALGGGVLDIQGNAGDNLGGAAPGAPRGMTGGEIVVRGGVGDGVGAAMRRGIIMVIGNAGSGLGRGMIAGTIVCMGGVGAVAGRFLKRGSIVGFGAVPRPATFRYACTYRPPHVRLLLHYLRSRYNVPVTAGHVDGRYARYAGDFAELGRGEILEWAERPEQSR